jgi:FtsZ-binding cell division protein ZapB
MPMDESTARDMIEDLQLEIAELRKRIRQLEAERDQWQRQAMSHG